MANQVISAELDPTAREVRAPMNVLELTDTSTESAESVSSITSLRLPVPATASALSSNAIDDLPSLRGIVTSDREPLAEDPESPREIVHENILFVLAGAMFFVLGIFALLLALGG